jgi:glycosyltransferase involved in cell wall biosynthesis
MSDLKVAWFSPLQPVESGISLYSEDLLPILSQVMRIDVVVDGYEPDSLPRSENIGVVHYRRFRASDYDLVVYQVGNSPPHLYMLPEIERTPGLLALHDTVLNHLYIQKAARDGTLLAYREAMIRRYGDSAGPAADRVLKGQAPDDLFRFPMSESVVEASRATIVHSGYARGDVLSRSPGAMVWRVPHGLRMPEYVSKEDARRALGWPTDQFTIASISHINPHKRIDAVLRALKQLRRTVPARLVLAGSVSPNFPLQRMINHLALDQVVDTPGYVSDKTARLIAAAADVIVNLRYPTAGETSGSLLHSMAAGRPVLVSATGSFTEVPDDAAVPIPVDALEESMLVATFERLARDDRLRRALGESARHFVETEHSPRRWADGYVEVISTLTGMQLESPQANVSEESVLAELDVQSERRADDLTRDIARDLAELGIGGDEDLLGEIATARVELGLGLGIITSERKRQPDRAGGLNDGVG